MPRRTSSPRKRHWYVQFHFREPHTDHYCLGVSGIISGDALERLGIRSGFWRWFKARDNLMPIFFFIAYNHQGTSADRGNSDRVRAEKADWSGNDSVRTEKKLGYLAPLTSAVRDSQGCFCYGFDLTTLARHVFTYICT